MSGEGSNVSLVSAPTLPYKIPVFWKGYPPRVIMRAIRFGLIKVPYTLRDYCVEAVTTMGYETNLDWGVQGAGKSSHMLQEGGWLLCKDKFDYEGWKKVLESLVMKPVQFVKKIKKVPMGQRIPWMGWDDVGVHYPSSKFKTDIRQYEAIDATWAAIRTKVNVISLSIPLIDRLAKNIKDNITNEVFIGRNQSVLVERYIRLPGVKDEVESAFRKIQIEPIHKFDILGVPTDVFKEYWEDMRLPLAEQAIDKLGDTIDPEKMINIHTVSDILQISVVSLARMVDRGAAKAEKIDGILHFTPEMVEVLKNTKLRTDESMWKRHSDKGKKDQETTGEESTDST